MVFVISVLSVISAIPGINPLACGCLSCLRNFRDLRRFREKHRIAKHRFAKPRFRNTRSKTQSHKQAMLEATRCCMIFSPWGVTVNHIVFLLRRSGLIRRPPVLVGAALFDDSAPVVYKQGSLGHRIFYTPLALN